MLWLHSGTQMCSKSQITISQPSKTKAANWVETKQISKLKHFSSCRKITLILVLCLPVVVSALSHGPAVLFLFSGLRAQAHGVGNTTILWLEVENSSHFLGDTKRLNFWEPWYQRKQPWKAAFIDTNQIFSSKQWRKEPWFLHPYFLNFQFTICLTAVALFSIWRHNGDFIIQTERQSRCCRSLLLLSIGICWAVRSLVTPC